MPKALQHEFPRWQDDPHAENSNGESREVWFGAMRVVSAKRARKLRKRGVPLMPLHAVHTVTYSTPCGGALRVRIEPTTPSGRARYAWFECKDDAERRIGRRRLQCYLTATQADPNTLGRKAELARRLADQRADHAAHEYFRKGGKLAATTYFQTFERYAGVPYENVLNPQLDLYAEVARQIGLATPEQLDAAASVDMRDYYAALENPLQRATRETMLQAERDGLVQRAVSFARADGGIDEVDPYGRVTVHVPALLQREDETDREFVQRAECRGTSVDGPCDCGCGRL